MPGIGFASSAFHCLAECFGRGVLAAGGLGADAQMQQLQQGLQRATEPLGRPAR